MSRAPFLSAALLAVAVLSGCADGVKQGDDLAPMIVDAYAADGESIELEEAYTVIWVSVYDEDLENLTYLWVTSEWGQVPDELVDDTPEGSQVTLEKNPDLHRQDLSLQVTDSSGNSVRLDWPLIVKPDAR